MLQSFSNLIYAGLKGEWYTPYSCGFPLRGLDFFWYGNTLATNSQHGFSYALVRFRNVVLSILLCDDAACRGG
jgi:hypothetical protein